MSAAPAALQRDDVHAVLRTTLYDLHGPAAELEDWTAAPLTKRGRQRAVRYQLSVRLADASQVERYEWVGKSYARPEEGQRVATLLQQLSEAGTEPRGAFVIPRVLAYHAGRGLLLLSYEAGESVTKAIARDASVVLDAIGRALAALHSVPVAADCLTDPRTVLADLKPRVRDLAGRFPEARTLLHGHLGLLRGDPPRLPTSPALLHGDLGMAQLLWRDDALVVLDFDEWTRGDPALDLGTFLTQLRRLTLRKPEKLPRFEGMRSALLQAYRRRSTDDADLEHRVAWYERATLLRKIHSLAFDVTRHPEADALRRRQVEAQRLLERYQSDAG